MSIPVAVRQQVRECAVFACDYCGVNDADVGGEQTVDHFRPQSKGGTDDLANLVYCCPRRNSYKMDYWPETSEDLHLWNPRFEPATSHFFELEDGSLLPLTETGLFSIRRLRLNRPPLIAYRLRKRQQAEQERLLILYRDLTALNEQLLVQQRILVEEQQQLLREQQLILQKLLAQLD